MTTAIVNGGAVVNGGGGGGGASLPDTPAAVLLDVAAPSTIVALDADGEGTALSYAAVLAAVGATPGATIVDPLSGTEWTTTPQSGVTVTWSGTALTLAAAAGTTGLGFVTRDATPLGASSTSWEIAVRLDVTAGDGLGAPRGFFLLGFYLNASNYSLSTLRSDRYVGMFTNISGTTTNVGETTGPSSGDLTGGQFWLRHSRTQNGQFIAWWGVGTGGALPTAWRQLYTVSNVSLMTALPTTTTIYVGSGAYGEGAIASPWTVEVLAIRMTSVGSL